LRGTHHRRSRHRDRDRDRERQRQRTSWPLMVGSKI
jgi:hypothetical protein